MEQVGSKCWVSGRSCRELLPWVCRQHRGTSAGDEGQGPAQVPPAAAPPLGLYWGDSYSKLQCCHTPSLPAQVSAHSWKTSPVFVISQYAKLNFNCRCIMGHSLLLIWGRQAVLSSVEASRGRSFHPLRYPSAFYAAVKPDPLMFVSEQEPEKELPQNDGGSLGMKCWVWTVASGDLYFNVLWITVF